MWALAWPLVVAELGWMLQGAVDLVMAGPLGAAAIGAGTLGNMLFYPVAVCGTGVLLGRLRASALDVPGQTTAEEVMEAGPSTVRPSISAEKLAQSCPGNERVLNLVLRDKETPTSRQKPKYWECHKSI